MSKFPETYFERVYVGRGDPWLKGKLCRILKTWRHGGPHNVQVQFLHGATVVCPIRCTRKLKPIAQRAADEEKIQSR